MLFFPLMRFLLVLLGIFCLHGSNTALHSPTSLPFRPLSGDLHLHLIVVFEQLLDLADLTALSLSCKYFHSKLYRTGSRLCPAKDLNQLISHGSFIKEIDDYIKIFLETFPDHPIPIKTRTELIFHPDKIDSSIKSLIHQSCIRTFLIVHFSHKLQPPSSFDFSSFFGKDGPSKSYEKSESELDVWIARNLGLKLHLYMLAIRDIKNQMRILEKILSRLQLFAKPLDSNDEVELVRYIYPNTA